MTFAGLLAIALVIPLAEAQTIVFPAMMPAVAIAFTEPFLTPAIHEGVHVMMRP